MSHMYSGAAHLRHPHRAPVRHLRKHLLRNMRLPGIPKRPPKGGKAAQPKRVNQFTQTCPSHLFELMGLPGQSHRATGSFGSPGRVAHRLQATQQSAGARHRTHLTGVVGAVWSGRAAWRPLEEGQSGLQRSRRFLLVHCGWKRVQRKNNNKAATFDWIKAMALVTAASLSARSAMVALSCAKYFDSSYSDPEE